MEVIFALIFIPSIVVWILFQNIGKGGFIDEALSAGLLVIQGSDKEDKNEETR